MVEQGRQFWFRWRRRCCKGRRHTLGRWNVAQDRYTISKKWKKRTLGFMLDHAREELFVHTFVTRAKRDRYQSLLANPRKRAKILDVLNHNADLDWRLATSLQPKGLFELEALLLSHGSSPEGCYLLSNDEDLDGTTVSLRDGIRLADEFHFASILDCIPGRLAVYWGEAAADRVCFMLVKEQGGTGGSYS